MNPKRQSVRTRPRRLTLARLSDPRIWTWPMAVFASSITLFLTLVTDILRLNEYDWLWLVPWALSTGICLVIGIIASLAFSRLKPMPFFWVVNLLVGAVLGAVKNTSVNYFAGLFGLIHDDIWLFRVFGGVFMGVALVSFFALSTGARYDHRVAVSTLRGIQERLLTYRDNLTTLVARENQKLISATQEVLIPKLRRIESLLLDGSGLNTVVDELRTTIEKDIRPLTKNIADVAVDSGIAGHSISEVKLREVRLPKLSVAAELILPGQVLFFNTIAYVWFFSLLDGTTSLWWVLLAAAGESVIQFAFKQTFELRLEPLRKVVVKLSVVALTASVPLNALVYSVERPITQLVYLQLMVWLVSFGSLFLNGFSLVLDQERLRVENELVRENEMLEHDISIAEQRIWVFKKSWQLVLHGTVQAALTAALTRLSQDHQDSSVRDELVKQDLKRAEKALHSSPSRSINFADASAELITAWRGVCEVSIEASERAQRALKRNDETMFCINELMRESVSNAVRHGAAKSVQINIDRITDTVLEFVAKNDGIPLSSNVTPGLGSQTLDELTLDWSRTSEKRTGKTVLSARVAVKL